MDVPKGVCGCKVTTCTIILGCLSLIGSFLMLCSCIVILSGSETLANEIDAQIKNKHPDTDENVHSLPYIRIASIIGCILFSVQLLISILAIVGVKTKRAKLLLPYIIWSIISITLYVIYGLLKLIMGLQDTEKYGGIGRILGDTVGMAIGVAISIYFVLIVRRCFNYLRSVRA